MSRAYSSGLNYAKVLLMSVSTNSLTKRIQHAFQRLKVPCATEEVKTVAAIEAAVAKHKPDFILCPFMTVKIPESIYTKKLRPCLILHPGIAGDRGASSIDWAIHDHEKEWGVTVLEATDVLDGGAIWSTINFPIPEGSTKTSLYVGPVSDAGVSCAVDSYLRFTQGLSPVDLAYDEIKGRPRENMKKSDRKIDWHMSSEDIETLVRMSDTNPGAPAQLCSTNFRLFDGFAERGTESGLIQFLLKKATPGQIVAHRNKSVLVKTGDNGGGVWIGQMKKDTRSPSLKLASTTLLEQYHDVNVPYISEPCVHDDVRTITQGPICYVYFDFYNGAMDTEQAKRLQQTLEDVKKSPDVKTVALMGGQRLFSTGIHLCDIENSPYIPEAAWRNINAINDVIKTIVTMRNKVSVAVLRGNAGAGGAMFAAACDVVMSHPGVLLTPSYKSMNLEGSEYWTYFLPRRVGQKVAKELVSSTVPISAQNAKEIGLVDHVFGNNLASFVEEVPEMLNKVLLDKADDIIRDKGNQRDPAWEYEIHTHRDAELQKMRENFLSNDFAYAMHSFVYKLPYGEKATDVTEKDTKMP